MRKEKIPGSPHFSVLQATESWAGPGNEATVKNPLPYNALLITSYCALRRKDSLCALAHRCCISRKGGTGGGGWGHPQGAVHMADDRLGLKKPWLVPSEPILDLAA